MTTNHLTPAQPKDGVMILQEGQGWGYGMSVAVERTPSGVPAGAIGWIGGFGSKWQSDPARSLRAILLTQRMFDDAKPAPIFETFEQDARKLAEQHLVRILPCTPPQLQALARLARKGKSPSPTEAQSTARHARLLQEEIELP